MDSKGETIEIEPKARILSPAELTKHRQVDVQPLSLGLKRTQLSGDSKEGQELEKLHAGLKKQISVHRIERLAGRALAEWDAQAEAVRVTHKDGKFGNFGYSRNGQLYLEYFEALFLLELGRLQLEYNAQIVSIEQAYLLLLGDDASPKYNEYLVYSNFMRVGYILVKHQNSASDLRNATWVYKSECAWELLFNAVHKKMIPSRVINSPHYNEVKQSMESVKQRIRDQDDKYKQLPSADQPYIDFQRKIQTFRKRKSTYFINRRNKRRCIETKQRPRSYLDMLKHEPEYQQFKELFQKFDVIELSSETAFDETSRDLTINFDVYLHNDGFRKSAPCREAKFRLVLLERDAAFPTHAEISKCYNSQHFKVPLLVVSISESKQIQAFIYFFT